MRKQFTEEEIRFLIDNYPLNGIDYCATILNRSRDTIKTKSYSLGLSLAKKINIECFKNIKSKEAAYILGLLWADGHVTFANNKTKTPIVKHTSKPDDNSIFIKILNVCGNWNSFTTKNVGSYAKTPKLITVNWVSSRVFGEFLIENDYRNKIASPNKILSLIPNNLKYYWFRGFFDGDGSVTIEKNKHHSACFTGHELQDWTFIIKLFNDLNIEKYKHRIVKSRDGKSSQIRISNKLDLLKLEDYLYLNYEIDGVGLCRKRNQFKLL